MNLPVEVIEAIAEGRCILFVGSRFSSEAAEEQGLPYPDDAALAAELGWRRPRQMMGVMKTPGTGKGPAVPSVAEGCQLYEAAAGRPALLRLLGERIGGAGLLPTPAHRDALRRFPLIFTTNLDGLLESAAPTVVRRRGDPVPDARPPLGGTPLVYKLRGDLEHPAGLVLSRADWQRLAHHPDDARRMRSLLRSSVVFFVGYRLDDEEFDLLWSDLTACFGGELPRCHLAVSQGRIDDYLWQKWVWRGLLLFTADPSEVMAELRRRDSADV